MILSAALDRINDPEVSLFVLLLLIMVGIIYLSRWIVQKIKESGNTISAKTNKEYKNLCKKREFFWHRLFRDFYAPSVRSSIAMGVIAFGIYALSHFIQTKSQTLSFVNGSHYQNLIAIYSGIAGIIFALIIFVAESLRDEQSRDQARVILRTTYLYPLVVLAVLNYSVYAWGDVNSLGVVPVLFLGAFSIFSLFRLFRILLDRSENFNQKIKLLTDRLRLSIDGAIRQRLGNVILFKWLTDYKIPISFYPFTTEGSAYYNFTSKKSGIVADIDLGKLEDFAKMVEEAANKNDFSFFGREGKALSINTSTDTTEPSEGSTRTYSKNDHVYFGKLYRDEVKLDDVLLSVKKDIIGDQKKVLDKLNATFKKIYVVKKEEHGISEQNRLELSAQKDQFIAAVKAGSMGKIREGSAIYLSLAETFLKALNECGGGYSFDQARREMGSIISRWNEADWLQEDISEIHRAALDTHDQNVIDEIAFLPMKIVSLAIESRDHFIFQTFIQFQLRLYLGSLRENDTDLKRHLLDRSWRYLKESADFWVEHEITKEDNEKDIPRLKDFAIYYFSVFQTILREAVIKKDKDGFELFAVALSGLFDSFKYTLEDERTRQPVADAIKEIWLNKDQMIFGLTSWIFSEYKKNPNNETTKSSYGKIQSLIKNNIVDLTSTFLSVHDFKVGDFWGWDRWDMIADGQVHTIDVSGKIERYFIVRGLKILATMTDDNIRAIELPTNRNMAFQADSGGGLLMVLEQIQNNQSDWDAHLTPVEIGKIDLFKALLQKAKAKQESDEQEQVKASPISEKKRKEFIQEFLEGYRQSSYFRHIVKHYGNLVEKPNDQISENRLGVNMVEDKQVFFEHWHVHYSKWGNQFGHDMARAENDSILSKVVSFSATLNETDLDQVIERFTEKNDIIIIALNQAIFGFFHQSNKFEYKRFDDPEKIPSYSQEGWWKIDQNLRIPVFEIHDRNQNNAILVLNKKKMGRLEQYSPLRDAELPSDQVEHFYFSIKAFSENPDLMTKIISNPPAWLTEKGNEEQQKDHLKGKVWMKIYESYAYNKGDDFEGYIFPVANPLV